MGRGSDRPAVGALSSLEGLEGTDSPSKVREVAIESQLTDASARRMRKRRKRRQGATRMRGQYVFRALQISPEGRTIDPPVRSGLSSRFRGTN